MPRLTLALGMWLLAVVAPPVRAGDELTKKINAVLNAADYKQAHWGILVVDAKSGKTLFAHNAEKLFAPASTTKLFSCATALCTLGPDFQFRTPVYRRGVLSAGLLAGDLILVGAGDLTLGGRTTRDDKLAFKDSDHTYANGNNVAELTDTNPLAGLQALARQVKDAGVKQVLGDVLVDDRVFVKARGSGSGPDLVSPIMV